MKIDLLQYVHESFNFRTQFTVKFKTISYFVSMLQVRFADWLQDDVTLNVYFIVYYSFRVIFVHVGPCISLVILNLLLFKAMREAQLKRDKLFKENRKSECKKLRDSNCTTLMLIVVVTVFLLTEIPLAVVTVSKIFYTRSKYLPMALATDILFLYNLKSATKV